MKAIATSILALLLNVTSTVLVARAQTVTITSGGVQRTMDVHLPAATPSGLPVLICYHGSGGNSANIAATTGFNALADQYHFIAVYPQSLNIGGDLQWNAYVDGAPGDAAVNDPNAPDDVLFTSDIINYLATTYSFDTKRVYATGLSNGGFMCYALSMFASDKIAAIAPVAGNLWADQNYLTTFLQSGAAKPIPVMHVHGTADNVVDYPDPDNTPNDYQEYPLFVASRGCGALTYSSVVPIMQDVDKLVFCPPPVEVSLIRIKGMQHAWSNGVYPTSLEIAKFFGLAPSGSNTVASEFGNTVVQLNSSVVSNELSGSIGSTADIQIISPTGAVLMNASRISGPFNFSVSNISTGMYFLLARTKNGQSCQKVAVAR